MKSFLAESGVEEVCLEYFADAGWQVLYGPEIAPGEPAAERSSYRDVLLDERLRRAVGRFNPHLPADAVEDVLATVRRTASADLLTENWRIHQLVTNGVPVEYRDVAGTLRHDTAGWSTSMTSPATTSPWSTRCPWSRTNTCGDQTCWRTSTGCRSAWSS